MRRYDALITGKDLMKILKSIAIALFAALMMQGAAFAESTLSIPSLDATAAAEEKKRPPKCIFIWGSGFPKFDNTGGGSLTVRTGANRYSARIEQFARSGGVIPKMTATDEADGERIVVEMKNVRVTKFQIISAGKDGRASGNDILLQEWSLTYETIQRVM